MIKKDASLLHVLLNQSWDLTFAIVLALAPFVLAGDTAGVEVVRPMAVVMLGGLITTALLALFVLPSLYLRFGAAREPVMELTPEPGAAN